MNGFRSTLDDIDTMALYWQRRKREFVIEAGDEFAAYVDPMYFHQADPTQEQLMMVNMCFTEWALFERVLRDGQTPLELFASTRPVALPRASWGRLDQVVASQFFSRFIIHDKEPATGMLVLEDVVGGRRYDVFDEDACSVAHWREGTLGVRIACVDGAWLAVGQARLYDAAPPESTAVDGPGAIHPEERDRLPPALLESFYLRLLHDTLGADGRYHHTLRVREAV